MSDRRGTGPRSVTMPDIHPLNSVLNPDRRTPDPTGPQNLLIRWELAPFRQLAQDVAGDQAKEWIDYDAWVLSLWTLNPDRNLHFCLSRAAVLDMARQIPEVLRND